MHSASRIFEYKRRDPNCGATFFRRVARVPLNAMLFSHRMPAQNLEAPEAPLDDHKNGSQPIGPPRIWTKCKIQSCRRGWAKSIFEILKQRQWPGKSARRVLCFTLSHILILLNAQNLTPSSDYSNQFAAAIAPLLIINMSNKDLH